MREALRRHITGSLIVGLLCAVAALVFFAWLANEVLAGETRGFDEAARSFVQLGGDREAIEILANSLEREWDPELVELYGECRVTDATRQLEQAERWLTRHNQDAVLLRVLGTLCQRQQLWGKAQTYLEASLALDNAWRAQLALGEMLGRLGRSDEANVHLVAALKLATEELRHAREV